MTVIQDNIYVPQFDTIRNFSSSKQIAIMTLCNKILWISTKYLFVPNNCATNDKKYQT